MLPSSLQKLVGSFSKLPGVGKKTAQRYAYFLLRSNTGLSREIGETLLSMQHEIALCKVCCMLTDSSDNEEGSLCPICKNPRRDTHTVCVVESIFDLEAIEQCGEYHGLYHVLHGRISPLDGIGPEDIKIKELVARIKKSENPPALEILIATNPSSEGEATALYLQKILKSTGVKLTRIATGIPMGADLEYADEITLARAIKGRQKY